MDLLIYLYYKLREYILIKLRMKFFEANALWKNHKRKLCTAITSTKSLDISDCIYEEV